MNPDPFHLERFVQAQAGVWDSVRHELETGCKRGHWMWFVFPQLAALGRSPTAKFYGIGGIDEARAYLAHPVLGPRLVDCVRLLLRLRDARDLGAREVFGEVDAMKLRSCLSLFAAAAAGEPVFGLCLQRYFGGQADELTVRQLEAAGR